MGNDPVKLSNMQNTIPKNYKRDQEGRAKNLCWHDNLHHRPS